MGSGYLMKTFNAKEATLLIDVVISSWHGVGWSACGGWSGRCCLFISSFWHRCIENGMFWFWISIVAILEYTRPGSVDASF